ALTAAPLCAFAGGSVDVFYMDQDLDLGSPANFNDDGDGYGFRGLAELGHGVSLTALHQDADLDTLDANLKETRIGLSYDRGMDGFVIGGGLETVTIDLNGGGPGTALRGYSANIHASMSPIDNTSVYARVGYTDLDEGDGVEYELGASYAFTPEVAGFVEYRMMKLDTDLFGPKVDLDLDTLRVGARYTFQ
ncbi:MAG: porin, partial [Paraperlucidibaca sp.]